jgi:hypothetical protein
VPNESAPWHLAVRKLRPPISRDLAPFPVLFLPLGSAVARPRNTDSPKCIREFASPMFGPIASAIRRCHTGHVGSSFSFMAPPRIPPERIQRRQVRGNLPRPAGPLRWSENITAGSFRADPPECGPRFCADALLRHVVSPLALVSHRRRPVWRQRSAPHRINKERSDTQSVAPENLKTVQRYYVSLYKFIGLP